MVPPIGAAGSCPFGCLCRAKITHFAAVNWRFAVGGLLFYIVLGMMALKYGKTRKTRIRALIAAQAVFLYIVLVALTKNPLLF